jgi:hypothetical protein
VGFGPTKKENSILLQVIHTFSSVQVIMLRSKRKKSRTAPTDFNTGLFAWAGNLAIFYVILLGLIAIPFLVLFVILSIRAALDYYIWILVGVFVLLAVAAFLLIQRRKQLRKRFEEEKEDVMEVIRTAAHEGHNVNISFLHGLIRLDYQGSKSDGRLLEGPTRNKLKALPLGVHSDESFVLVNPQNPSEIRPFSIAIELEKLTELHDRGVLTETEFQELKERLLKAEEQ